MTKHILRPIEVYCVGSADSALYVRTADAMSARSKGRADFLHAIPIHPQVAPPETRR